MFMDNHKDNDVIAQAVAALGEYAGAPNKVRKDVVEGLLKIYEPAASAVRKSSPKTADKVKFEKLNRPMLSSLKALTGATENTNAGEWGRWWRKTGKKTKDW